MTRRPTIKDIAREAGVGVATVDRVLNQRTKVREDTMRRVAEAAERVGYHAAALIRHRSAPPLPKVRMGFLFHKEAQAFYRAFAETIRAEVAARVDVEASAVIRFSPSQTPEDFGAGLRALAAGCDVLASTAVNHPATTQAVEDLHAEGVEVFALLNDFAQGVRRGYLGLNNMKVGRIAAWMIATRTHGPGKVAVFVGGNRWHSHLLRETGLHSYMREYAPELQMLDTFVNLETRQVTYEATVDLLNRHPDLRGIYVAGGGMEGAIAALREARPPGKVSLVVNELTDDSRDGLREGYISLVIATPLDRLCRDLVDQMVATATGEGAAGTGQHFLDPQLYTPESV